jgi:hypothetical protein
VEVRLHAFLTLALDGGEGSTSCLSRFIHCGTASDTFWTEGCVEPRAGLDAVNEKNESLALWEIESQSSTPYPSYYTDWLTYPGFCIALRTPTKRIGHSVTTNDQKGYVHVSGKFTNHVHSVRIIHKYSNNLTTWFFRKDLRAEPTSKEPLPTPKWSHLSTLHYTEVNSQSHAEWSAGWERKYVNTIKDKATFTELHSSTVGANSTDSTMRRLRQSCSCA